MLQSASTLDHRISVLTRQGIPVLLLGLSVLAVVRKAATPVTNADTYFHLRFGHEFLHGAWTPWNPGHVSSFEHGSWAPTQWLSQVVLALVEDHTGLAGVAWLCGIAYVGFVLALFWAARRRAALLPAAVLVPVALIACWPNITARPQVLSFILTTVSVAVWQTARDRSAVPWLLIPTTWLWAMLHGMWPVGVAIGLAAAVGIALDSRPPRTQTIRLLAVPVLSLVVAGLTPVGPRLYSAVLVVNSRNQYFGEWQPPDFRSTQSAVLLALLAVTVLMLAKAPSASWFDALLVLGALVCAVYSQRTVPVAAAMLVPLAAAAADRALKDRRPPTRRESASVAGIAALAVVVLTVAVPNTSSGELTQPAWVDAELASLPADTPVLDDLVFGSYLLWKYPNLNLVEHGYGDVYTTQELDDHRTIDAVRPGWDRIVRATGATIALEKPDAPLTYALRLAGWTVEHSSEEIVMLNAPPGWLTAAGQTS
jgi:hypothetical protein